MNDTVKTVLVSTIVAVLVQIFLGPQIMKMTGMVPAQPQVVVQPQPIPQPQPVVVEAPAPPAPNPTAPDYRGITVKKARSLASAQGIVIIEDEQRDAPDKRPGEILEQDPPPGTILVAREIRVVVAKAREAKVPNLVGKTIAEAKTSLDELGVEFTEIQKDSSKTPGTVLSQKPAAGVKVSPGTPVELTIAALPLIEVPAVTGKYLTKAKSALKDAGLDTGDIKRVEHEEHGENYVLKQDPPAGTKVPFGTTVSLTVVAPN